MVELDILPNIINKLLKARGVIGESTAMFGGLPIIILMRDFY